VLRNGYTASRFRQSASFIGVRLSPHKRKAVEARAKTAVRRLLDLGLASAYPSAARMKKAMEASEMAGQEIDRWGHCP
jgi:hypothetical protein